MKKIILIVIFITSMLPLFSQDRNEKQVADAVEQLRLAMVNADKYMLEKLTSTKLNYGHSSGQIDDQSLFIEKIVSGKSDFVSIDLTEQTISISANNAVVRHLLYAKTNDGGNPGEVRLRVLLVWQKLKGSWKLLARQAVRQ
jgi:hypothetical protein